MSNPERQIDRLEFDIVAAGTGVGMGLPSHDRLQELSSRDPDWNRVGQLATYHGVYPVLFQALEHAVDDAPADTLKRLHRGYIDTAARNLQQIQELGRVSRYLKEGGVRMISFKGPVLAHEAYRNLALRPSIDLDLLVASDDFDRAADLLEKDGYTAVMRPEIGSLKRRVHRYLSQQVPYVKDRTYALDVHMNIMPPGYYYAFSFATLYERSHVATIAGQSIRSFQAEDVLQ
ncbi:MAG: nucleotidyltransferase family protein, partial [Rhodothermales bacterium]|nr:nucleotidyltransferase family protein [Rhodothermales bacterium]